MKLAPMACSYNRPQQQPDCSRALQKNRLAEKSDLVIFSDVLAKTPEPAGAVVKCGRHQDDKRPSGRSHC